MDLIYSKERDIDDQLVEKHFLVQDLGDLFKNLKTSKDDPEKDKQLVNVIKSGLRDLQREIENISEEEKKKRKTKMK